MSRLKECSSLASAVVKLVYSILESLWSFFKKLIIVKIIWKGMLSKTHGIKFFKYTLKKPTNTRNFCLPISERRHSSGGKDATTESLSLHLSFISGSAQWVWQLLVMFSKYCWLSTSRHSVGLLPAPFGLGGVLLANELWTECGMCNFCVKHGIAGHATSKPLLTVTAKTTALKASSRCWLPSSLDCKTMQSL